MTFAPFCLLHFITSHNYPLVSPIVMVALQQQFKDLEMIIDDNFLLNAQQGFF